MPRFDDSSDAQQHIDHIEALILDGRLTEWVRSTDINFNTTAAEKLEKVMTALQELKDELDSAC